MRKGSIVASFLLSAALAFACSCSIRNHFDSERNEALIDCLEDRVNHVIADNQDRTPSTVETTLPKGIVLLEVELADGQGMAHGMGFVVAPGVLATAAHMVPSEAFEARIVDGPKITGVAASLQDDVALFFFNAEEYPVPPIPLADSLPLEGEGVVMSVFNQFGELMAVPGVAIPDTESGKWVFGYVHRGMSGGPVIQHGKVVGVVVIGANQGPLHWHFVGYTPVDRLKALLELRVPIR